MKLIENKNLDNSWGCADKFYFVPRHFQTTWENARSICRSYNMEIATFETLEEMQVVSDLCKDNENIMTPYVHVGGMTTREGTKESWFWIVTGKRINYNMPWADGEPNNDEDSQFCLALGTKNFLFDDIDCFGRSESKFICQYKVDNYLE